MDFTFRFVAALMKRSDEDELKYTEEVIGANFSNYSAWHNRRYAKSLLFQKYIPIMTSRVFFRLQLHSFDFQSYSGLDLYSCTHLP